MKSKLVEGNKLYWAKEEKDWGKVVIPNKREEDAGYDIYPYFKEEEMVVKSGETVIIPTGLYCAFSEKYYMQLQERGSSGTKGIAQRCGVIDSGYRGEIMIPITNTSNKTLIITKGYSSWKDKEDIEDNYIVYDYNKAISQAILLEVPKMTIEEIDLGSLKNIPSFRGEGKLGSSGK